MLLPCVYNSSDLSSLFYSITYSGLEALKRIQADNAKFNVVKEMCNIMIIEVGGLKNEVEGLKEEKKPLY